MRKKSTEEVVALFKNVIPVKGYFRSILYDLYKEDYVFISNNVYDLLIENNCILSLPDLSRNCELQDLLEKDLLQKVFIDELDFFSDLSLEWDHPNEINNVVIEFNLSNIEYLIKISHCKSYCIIFENYGEYVANVEQINRISKLNDLLTIEVVILDFNGKDIDNFDLSFFSDNSKLLIHRIFIFNCNEYKIFRLHETLFIFLNYERIVENKDLYQHIVNIKLFTEAQKHNTYYNRKIFVDKKGDLKLNLKSNKSLSKLFDLKDDSCITKIDDLKKYWFITKDQIDVCKECEFRYMCIDSSDINERNDGSFYRSEECNYNPYIAKWDFETDYKNLIDSGVNCNKLEFFIDQSVLQSIQNIDG